MAVMGGEVCARGVSSVITCEGGCVFGIFFFKQKTAYEMLRSLVGSEMCIRDSYWLQSVE